MNSQEALAVLQSVSIVDTVRGNYECFTKKYVGKSISDRKEQTIIGSPYEKYFKELFSENYNTLKSIPVTCADITNTHTIFGPDLSGPKMVCVLVISHYAKL